LAAREVQGNVEFVQNHPCLDGLSASAFMEFRHENRVLSACK
jgi:hypothetical protein